jgi:hypothetical protein
MSASNWFERDLLGDTTVHDRDNEIWVGSTARAVTSSRMAQLVSVALVVTSALTGDWGLVLLMPPLFFAFFALRLLDGRGRQTAIREARTAPIRLPESLCFSDGTARTFLMRLERARQSLQALRDASPHQAAFDVSGALDRVPELERHVLVLASRVEYLARFLDGGSIEATQLELEGLTRRADRTSGMVREGYRLAAERCQARLEATAALQAEWDRLAATAEQALGTLEELPPRLTSLQMRRFEACDDRSRRTNEEVARLEATLQVFDETSADGAGGSSALR